MAVALPARWRRRAQGSPAARAAPEDDAREGYAAFNVATGDVLGRITEKHRPREFLDFLKQIDRAHVHSIELHLILDNSSTHKTPEVNRWLETHPRSHLATTSGVAAGTRCYSRDVIVPNAGHMMHLQKGHEVFQREVAGFFKTP